MDDPAGGESRPAAGRQLGRQARALRRQGLDYARLSADANGAVAHARQGRRALAQSPQESILYRGDKEIANGDLVEIIEKNRDVFRRSFAADAPAFSYDPNSRQASQVVADKAGNIWRLEEGGRLLVLVGDRWLLAHEPLVAAGSPGGAVSYTLPLGDGQKIYGSDRGGMPGRLGGFFGEVKDGKLLFAEAPKIEIRDNDSLKVRDADGSIWAVCNLKDATGNYRQNIICLGGDGIREKLDCVGNPKLVDAAGNLWLEKGLAPAGCTYKLWRKGEWLAEITVPNVTRTYRPFSDRPGSVYVWTSQGLQQLLADPPDFKQFRLGPLYSIDNLSGELIAWGFSKQGFVVLLMQGGADNSPWTLGVLRLPEEKKGNEAMGTPPAPLR